MLQSEIEKAKHLLLGHHCFTCNYCIGIHSCLYDDSNRLPEEKICSHWKAIIENKHHVV